MSTLDLRVGGNDIDFDLIKVNGSYVKKWEMTINPDNELGISWSFDPATYANDFTYSNTRDTREDLNGYFGTMTMWSPVDNSLQDRLGDAVVGIDKDYGVDSDGAYYPLNSVTRTGQSISMVQFGKYGSLWSGASPSVGPSYTVVGTRDGASYSLTSTSIQVFEGTSVTFDLETTGVAQGTSVGYYLANAADDWGESGAYPTGSFIIGADGKASVTLTPLEDQVEEGAEEAAFILAGAGTLYVTQPDGSSGVGGMQIVTVINDAHDSLSQVRQNMPSPTFYVSGSNVNEVTTLTENATQTWPEWSSFDGDTGYYALQNYTVYKKPYIPDTTLSLQSNSTQNQYNGGVAIPSSITLSQPETFAAVSAIRIDGTVEPLASYSSFYALHQEPAFGSHRFALCIRAYAPHWDQDSDISISWSITGAGAPHVNEKGTDATSGTITNFQPIPTTAYGYTSAMSDYRYGYTEVYADQLPLGSGGLETFQWDFNIVPNGLKLHSASTSTVNLSGIL